MWFNIFFIIFSTPQPRQTPPFFCLLLWCNMLTFLLLTLMVKRNQNSVSMLTALFMTSRASSEAQTDYSCITSPHDRKLRSSRYLSGNLRRLGKDGRGLQNMVNLNYRNKVKHFFILGLRVCTTSREPFNSLTSSYSLTPSINNPFIQGGPKAWFLWIIKDRSRSLNGSRPYQFSKKLVRLLC